MDHEQPAIPAQHEAEQGATHEATPALGEFTLARTLQSEVERVEEKASEGLARLHETVPPLPEDQRKKLIQGLIARKRR